VEPGQPLARKRAEEANIEYKTIPGEAAFYGPKIDIKLVDAIGRLWQLSTVQFDFNLPQRFQLEYVAEDGTASSRSWSTARSTDRSSASSAC
jgi:threonyl-tRNA synthetase